MPSIDNGKGRGHVSLSGHWIFEPLLFLIEPLIQEKVQQVVELGAFEVDIFDKLFEFCINSLKVLGHQSAGGILKDN